MLHHVILSLAALFTSFVPVSLKNSGAQVLFYERVYLDPHQKFLGVVQTPEQSIESRRARPFLQSCLPSVSLKAASTTEGPGWIGSEGQENTENLFSMSMLQLLSYSVPNNAAAAELLRPYCTFGQVSAIA